MLKVALLGQYDLRLEEQPVELASRPAQALLAYLLLNRTVRHQRARLAGLLWPDYLESSARQSLRNALWQLRQAIGEEYLLADKASLAFNTRAPHTLDVAILEDETAVNDLDALIHTVSVYKGELLPGFYEDWVLLERERLQALYERRAQALLAGLGAAGRWREVQTWAERWIALGHAPEPAYRALMMAHAALGDQAGMANSYRRCRQALEDELGVAPSPETEALYRRLAEGTETLALPTQPTPPALAIPERALPIYSTPFVGRQEELAEIGRLLQEEPDCRLLTLVGPGGIGKTRLAVEAARATEFTHGAWFVPLAPLGSGASLVSAIADGLRLRLHGAADPGEQLFAYLRRRELLLVLDNFEHLLSPLITSAEAERGDSVALLIKLLEEAPQVKILVTSRERLHLSAEWVFHVEGLQIPNLQEGENSFDAAGFSAVQLFLQRARQLKRDFGQNAEEPACVARICQLVGGMPLAIELAAAWSNVLSCREIVQEIERSLDFLRTRLRDYPERHRDMRAVFDASWNMLTEPEQRLFRRLSVFRGGFTRAAAEAMGAETPWTDDDLSLNANGTLQLEQRQPQVLAALAGLVDKSFVRHTPNGRYEIHELLRQYGAAKLIEQPDEEQQARDNHARYYLTWLENQEAPLKGTNQRQVLELLVPDLENIKTAWKWAVVRQRLDWIARLFLGWLWFFEDHNDFEEAAAAMLHAVETFRSRGAPTSLSDSGERDNFAFLLSQTGWIAFRIGQIGRGLALSDEALSLAGPKSKPEHLWYMNIERGSIELATGNSAKARHFTQQALQRARELANPWYIGWPMAQLGIIALQEGEPQDAYQRLQESLAIWTEVGDPRGLFFACANLGVAALALGKQEEALEYAEKSLAISTDIGDLWRQANALNLIGQVQAAQGDYEAAKASYRKSAELRREVGDLPGLAQAMINHGNAALDAGEEEEAKAIFLEALRAVKRAGMVATGLSALVGLARVEAGRNRPHWAYSLASYVAEHPQASESARVAARQLCGEIEERIRVRGMGEMAIQFREDPFEEIVGSILDENP